MIERLYGQVTQAQVQGNSNSSVVLARAAVMSKKKLNLSIKRPSVTERTNLSKIAANARKNVPLEEWAKVPTDLSSNIDHYLYQNKKNS